MAPVTTAEIQKIDDHYSGALDRWKKRHQRLIDRDKHTIDALHTSAWQLFESYNKGHKDALVILDKVIACKSSHPCHQILCPACRDARQTKASNDALSAFALYPMSDLRFMTLLIRVEADAAKLQPLMRSFRTRFKQLLRNNARALKQGNLDFKMLGAFEIDLKALGTQIDASPRSQRLVKQLGLNTKTPKAQHLLHYHAVVGPLDDARLALLKQLIEKALGTSLLPHQLNFRSLHKHRAKDENLATLARYQFKARLQFADNIFDDNLMQKMAKYHTPFKGKQLTGYLNAVNDMQNFKGLKFNFGI